MDKIKPVIKIDVVSDVVCPWCYIGKRRLERAVQELSDDFNFDITYHPFELNPALPMEGVDQKQYLTKKFGGEARYTQLTQHVAQVAAGEGLTFDFDAQRVSPNTRNAHRVIELARQQGMQQVVKEAFMKAYFTDGIDLSKSENVTAIAVAAGMERGSVETLLEGEQGLAEIELAEAEMQRLGVSGVPFYIINNQYGISGAQPTDAFKRAFTDIHAREQNTAEACAIDGTDC